MVIPWKFLSGTLGKKDFKLAFEKFINRKECRINYNSHTKKYMHLNSVTALLPLKSGWKNTIFYSTCTRGSVFSSMNMGKCFITRNEQGREIV